MTFLEIISAVYDECNYSSAPDSTVTTRVKRFINEGVRAILLEPGLAKLADSDGPFTFASVANQARYTLPESVAQIRGISERTNYLALASMAREQYRRIEPNPAANFGVPTHWVPFGKVAVAVQPSDASEIFAKSTAAGDTTQTIFIEGVITGGYLRTASKTLNGTTAVSLDTTITSFIEITDVYLSAAAVGTVTLNEDSGVGTELARITIGATHPRYLAIALWPTPSAVVTYYVDYRRELVDMTNNTDRPPLPSDAHPMLVAYAVRREAEKTANTDLVQLASQRYTRYLTQLKYSTQTNSDEIPVMGRGGAVGHSRLGGMYPADYWTRS